ncbi:MAG: hypothetical protein HY331_04135 [Chloroflexi bacterium]|nr:hypothetical protein [Chloroflexota bacterium]
MAKVDRLGWADGVAFTSYGVTVGVRVTDPAALPRFVELLPPGWAPASSPIVEFLFSAVVGGPSPANPGLRRYHLLYDGAARLARSLDLEDCLAAFEQSCHLLVAERTSEKVFVHAGVVGWKGQAIVMPGRSYVGKTTLVAALIRAGATFYSDEYAVLDEAGRVHPYPRPLSLRRATGERPERTPPAALGATVGVEPLPVGLVLFGKHAPGRVWRPRRLSPARGLLALLDNAVAARRQPARVLSALEAVVARAAVVQGVRGEATELAARLLR